MRQNPCLVLASLALIWSRIQREVRWLWNLLERFKGPFIQTHGRWSHNKIRRQEGNYQGRPQ